MIDCMTCLCVSSHCTPEWQHAPGDITHGFVEGIASDPDFRLSAKLCELRRYQHDVYGIVWGFRDCDELFVVKAANADR